LGGSKVAVDVVTDHVELTSAHLVLGLQLQWNNRTANSIPVKDIQLKVYVRGEKKDALNFYPLERFERSAVRKAIVKSPIRPFTIPAHEARTEQIRFISQEVLDIEKGSYAAALQVTDVNEAVYEYKVRVRVRNEQKYRHTEEWERDE
jgi:hypothetical protein